MAYSIKPEDNALTLTLDGTVDLSETSEIKEAVRAEPIAGFSILRVNAADVEYIDSSGVALLLFLKRFAPEQGLVFEISYLSSAVQQVIDLAGLNKMIQAQHQAQVGTAPDINVEKSVDNDNILLDKLFDDPIESLSSDGNSSGDADFDIKPGDFS
jgi:anti-sigma B factor antagonist